MAPHVQASGVLQFGTFEVDLRAGELRKSGARIKLQEQPFQILTMLLEKPGEVITREELQQKLWPADTFVDFDDGLNTAIKKLRDTLGDSVDSPRFIETLPRRGYRFIYPVNGVRASAEARALAPMGWWRQPWVTGLLALIGLLAVLVGTNFGGLRDRITGRAESLALVDLIKRAGINVTIANPARPSGVEVQGDSPCLIVLEERGAALVCRCVDSAAEILRGLPAEVVALVVASRNINIVAAKPSGPVAGEIQAVSVGGKSRAALAGAGVDIGAKVLRGSPGVVNAGPL